jgi:hypothetical protein
MKLYSLVAIAVLAMTFNTQTCFEAGMLGTLGKLTDNPDPVAQEAAAAAEAKEKAAKLRELERKAMSTENIRKGSNIDTSGVDELIKADPNSSDHYLQKAALLVAKGDTKELEDLKGKALDVEEGLDADAKKRIQNERAQRGKASADMLYLSRYLTSLAVVQSALTPNDPSYKRVHAEFCSNFRLFERDWYASYTPGSEAENAIKSHPC